MTIKRFVVVLIVLFLALVGLISHVFAIDLPFGDGMRDSWEVRELVIQRYDKKTKEVIDENVGDVFIKQTQTKLKIIIAPGGDWELADTRIYVGLGSVPTAGNRVQIPVTASFPYRAKFSKTEKYYTVDLNLVDDLGIDFNVLGDIVTINMCIYTQIRARDAISSTSNKDNTSTINEDAWGRGLSDEDTIRYGDSAGYSFTFELDEDAVEMFRKNVSKNPECETTKAKIEILHYYVEARRACGDPVTLEYETIVSFDDDGNVLDTDFEERNVVKPLVAVYAEEIPGIFYPDIYTGEMTNQASDVFAAVSLDEGQTWKRKNLSRAADRSSFTLGSSSLYPGFEFPGEVKKPNVKQQGNNIMVAWTSKYAKSGHPTYALSEYLLDEEGNPKLDEFNNPISNPYYEEDIWGVGGAQRSKDYTNVEAGFPGIEIPYSVVWVCRGFVEQDGTIVWMKPERLTSGRRDAEQVAIASSPAGFAVVWQEDPDGLRPGDGAGPGHGWSGATTNHKTDIWYSYILMEDFQKIDYEFVSGGEPKCDPEDPDKGGGRPKALVPMKLPVRLTDNDTLNTDNMKIESSLLESCPENLNIYPEADATKLHVLYKSDLDAYVPPVEESNGEETTNVDDLGTASCDGGGGCGGGGGQGIGSGEGGGSHQYGLALADLLWRDDNGDDPYILFYETTNNQDVTKYVAITADGRLLDGDTGASRCNIMLQQYQKSDGTYSAWAIIGYEESKGTGSGPPDRDEDYECGCGDEDLEKLPGEGSGSDRYYPDRGKNVVYHSFDFQNPDVVSGGDILNPQEVVQLEASGVYELSWLVDKDGIELTDWKGDLIPNYENARRPRFIIQSKAMAIAGKLDDVKGTVMVSVFKMGREGKGRPADVMMVRWEASKADKGNPYAFSNLATREFTSGADGTIEIVDWQNLSSVTPVEFLVEETTKGEEYNRIYSWEQTEENLSDYTWMEPGINARAHRGFIRGDFLAIAYVYTPNWRQARNGHDIYNCYVRRSFDGGKTWTTDPLGDGVTNYEIMKELIRDVNGDPVPGDDGKPTFERYVETYELGVGVFEPARNISLFKNNKQIAIEPRLVGMPGTTRTVVSDLLKELVPDLTAAVGSTVTLFSQDNQDTSSFWMTFGTEATPDGEEGGEALDLFYSFSTDRGESFFTEADPTYLKEDMETMNYPFYQWNWLAKDRRGMEIEQAESQIRYLPNGSVFYAIWNESSELGSDAIFRRIFRGTLVGDIVNIKVDLRPIPEE